MRKTGTGKVGRRYRRNSFSTEAEPYRVLAWVKIDGYIHLLEGDPKALCRAAGQASKATRFLLNLFDGKKDPPHRHPHPKTAPGRSCRIAGPGLEAARRSKRRKPYWERPGEKERS